MLTRTAAVCAAVAVSLLVATPAEARRCPSYPSATYPSLVKVRVVGAPCAHARALRVRLVRSWARLRRFPRAVTLGGVRYRCRYRNRWDRFGVPFTRVVCRDRWAYRRVRANLVS